MYCKQCGKEIAESAAFCKYCGAPKEKAAPAAELLPPPPPPPTGDKKAEPPPPSQAKVPVSPAPAQKKSGGKATAPPKKAKRSNVPAPTGNIISDQELKEWGKRLAREKKKNEVRIQNMMSQTTLSTDTPGARMSKKAMKRRLRAQDKALSASPAAAAGPETTQSAPAPKGRLVRQIGLNMIAMILSAILVVGGGGVFFAYAMQGGLQKFGMVGEDVFKEGRYRREDGLYELVILREDNRPDRIRAAVMEAGVYNSLSTQDYAYLRERPSDELSGYAEKLPPRVTVLEDLGGGVVRISGDILPEYDGVYTWYQEDKRPPKE